MFVQALAWELPNITTVRAIIRLAWAASSGNLQLLNATPDELHRMHDKMATKVPDGEDVLGMYVVPQILWKGLSISMI
jgi:ubiquitin carboxyl-terminal hydrolase 9/24